MKSSVLVISGRIFFFPTQSLFHRGLEPHAIIEMMQRRFREPCIPDVNAYLFCPP